MTALIDTGFLYATLDENDCGEAGPLNGPRVANEELTAGDLVVVGVLYGKVSVVHQIG